MAPAAHVTDRAVVVPMSHLEALADAGLCRLMCPPAAPGGEVRQVYETLAGACGVTFFVWVQHHGPVRALAATDNDRLRARHLDDLCAGRVLGGVAFSHLRRPGPPAMVAAAMPGGYRIDGEAPWVTSWGLAGLFLVAARLDDRVVWFLLDSRHPDPAVKPSAPLSLAAMNASSTVRLRLDGLHVPEGDVVDVEAFAGWQERDRVTTAQPNPAALGIAATCVRLLIDAAPDAAGLLGDELDDCRSLGYGLADQGRTDPDQVAAMVDAR
ncbi:MAG: hypothetical protein M3Y04_04430, partial [Actinomycetota bacterium]|nr:hypothetical protein [Actinomycetota bacterium]